MFSSNITVLISRAVLLPFLSLNLTNSLTCFVKKSHCPFLKSLLTFPIVSTDIAKTLKFFSFISCSIYSLYKSKPFEIILVSQNSFAFSKISLKFLNTIGSPPVIVIREFFGIC